MDPIKILKRAWHILWSYRALWVFGLILALAGAGSHGNGSNSSSRHEANPQSSQQQPLPQDMREAFKQGSQEMQRLFNEGLTKAGISKEELSTLIWIGVIFVVLCLIFGLVLAVARYVSETAVIRMVDEYENTGTKMTIKQGFRIGWSRTSWRLFLINLLVNLPLILGIVLLLTGVGIAIFRSMSQGFQQPATFTIVALIGVMFLLIFVVAIISIFLGLLRHFFWRACALENLGVRESLSRGFQMARENWKNIGLMWLVMIGLGIVWAIVSIIAIILTIPVVLVTAVAGALVAVIPVLLAGGLTSLFLHGWLPWIVGALFVLPLFFTIAFSPWILLGSWQTVFASTVWTLVYRELKALPALTSLGVDVTPLPPVS
jgi:hypothetical protein